LVLAVNGEMGITYRLSWYEYSSGQKKFWFSSRTTAEQHLNHYRI